MISLRSYLSERVVPYSGFGLARQTMPQIKNMTDFTNYLDHLQISFERVVTSLSPFKPTQADIDDEKVQSIIDGMPSSMDKPIIASEDLFVLDGHHRYHAAVQSGVDATVVVVNLPINKLMRVAYSYNE